VTGNRLGDVSAAVQRIAESHGYGVVRELTGHGVGRRLHEDPDLPNFGHAGRGMRLEAGLVLAMEPMITLGSRHIAILEDGWTIVTTDRKPAAHYENTFAVTAEGPVILTAL
jgi:methionyl aminopeptidase